MVTWHEDFRSRQCRGGDSSGREATREEVGKLGKPINGSAVGSSFDDRDFYRALVIRASSSLTHFAISNHGPHEQAMRN